MTIPQDLIDKIPASSTTFLFYYRRLKKLLNRHVSFLNANIEVDVDFNTLNFSYNQASVEHVKKAFLRKGIELKLLSYKTNESKDKGYDYSWTAKKIRSKQITI